MNSSEPVQYTRDYARNLLQRLNLLIPESELTVEPQHFASGSSASIYRGLYKGVPVAVKRIFCQQGDSSFIREFIREI
jgi:hypothetical protein